MESSQAEENGSSNEFATQSPPTPRPKLYKIRQHLDDYYDVCLEHKNQELTRIYEFYMDIELSSVHRFQHVIAQLNKFFKLFNVYCLFYHSIWWQNTKFDVTLSFLNFDQIDRFLLLTLIYFNFGELFVRELLLRSLAFGFFKWLDWFAANTLKLLLDWSELCIYAFIELLIYSQFKHERKYSNMRIVVLLVPHLLVLFLNNFVVHLRFLNVDLLSNLYQPSTKQSHSKKQQQAEALILLKETSTSANNGNKLVYEDCSNISIDKYLNPSVPQVPHLTSAQSQTTATYNKSKIKNKRNSDTLFATSWSLIAKLKAMFFKCVYLLTTLKAYKRTLKIARLVFNTISLQASRIGKSSAFLLRKRSMFHSIPSTASFVTSSFSNCTADSNSEQSPSNNRIQHRCHNNSAGIRDECELLTNEYNWRLRTVLLHTFDVIYTNFFLVYFCLNHETINIRLVEFLTYLLASVLNVYLNSLTWHMPHWFYATLSRNAKHMGKWRHIKQQMSKLDKWNVSKIYCQGDQVTHMGQAYQVESKFCSSEPGNFKQAKFYTSFIDAHFISARHLLMLNMFFCFMLIYLLYNQRWYAILAVFLELALNTHLIYIIYRDFFLSKQLQVASEQDESEKKKKR
jgi:hypothetical protein